MTMEEIGTDKPTVLIRAFRAVDDPESAQKFIDGHARVLEMHLAEGRR